jgi:uncharacterized protein (TIGR00299 family) protein
MNTLYLDLSSGISGDMFVGALLDLGADFQQLNDALATLKVGGFHLHAGRRRNGGVSGTKFDVHLEHGDAEHTGHHPHHPHDHHSHDHGHGHGHSHGPQQETDHPHAHEAVHSHGAPGERNFRDIRELIRASPLSDWVKERSIAVFARLAEAEGKVHGLPADEVHFHEVGAVDSIVDIVGGCIGLELLGKPRVMASAVTEGTGFVDCAHGRLPVPVPATLELLAQRNVPYSQCEEPGELVTPTGAALLVEFAGAFGPAQDLRPLKVGYGLGTRENRTRPNVLRAILGESAVGTDTDWERDRVAVLETNLDDVSGEVLGNFLEQALAAGALDVFHTPIQMKKQRPGVLLSLLCPEERADEFSRLILTGTTAFGVRQTIAERRKLRRRFAEVTTAFGPVVVKEGRLDGRCVQWAPEYESCRQLAEQAGVPVREVFSAAFAARGSAG